MFESSVPVLILELQKIILWLLIGKSESCVKCWLFETVTGILWFRLCRSSLFVVIFIFFWQLSILPLLYVCFERGWVTQHSISSPGPADFCFSFSPQQISNKTLGISLIFSLNAFFFLKERRPSRAKWQKEALQYLDDLRYANTWTGCTKEVQFVVKEDLKPLFF